MGKNKNDELRKFSLSGKKESFSGKCDIRLTAEEDSMLNRLSRDNNVTRSDVMRRALRDYFKWNTDEEED